MTSADRSGLRRRLTPSAAIFSGAPTDYIPTPNNCASIKNASGFGANHFCLLHFAARFGKAHIVCVCGRMFVAISFYGLFHFIVGFNCWPFSLYGPLHVLCVIFFIVLSASIVGLL